MINQLKTILIFKYKRATVSVYEVIIQGDQEIWFYPSIKKDALRDKYKFIYPDLQDTNEEALKKLYETGIPTFKLYSDIGWEE